MRGLRLIIGNRNYSSWSLRAWLYLAANHIAFEEIRIPLDQPGTAAALARHSPSARVPVLRDGTLVIWESLAICEHIAEREALPAWPVDPPARAWARAAAHEMHAGFAALRAELPMNCRARGRRVTPSPQARQDIERALSLWSEGRERFAAAGPWLAGDFGIVDAMYAPVALRFLTYGIEVPAPARGWVDTLLGLDPMRRWLDAAAAEVERIDCEELGE